MDIVIGITGLNRAGKGTLAQYLVDKYGFKVKSVRSFIEGELEKEGKPFDRDNLRQKANELREKFGPEYIVMELYKQAQKEGGKIIIESIRTVGEVEALKELPGFELWAVTAPLELCHERALSVGSATDNVTIEEFERQIELESISEDKGVQNLPKCIELADVVLTNDSSVESFHEKISIQYEKRFIRD